MKQVIDVNTGEVKAAGKDTVLRSNGIGSCVVVVFYESISITGALAHIMLPGAAREGKSTNTTRYAVNAIERLLVLMKHFGADKKNIISFLIGGGNVLKRSNDTICQENITSIKKLLKENNIPILKSAVGGTFRRTVIFDIKNASILYTEGNSKQKLLWQAGQNLT